MYFFGATDVGKKRDENQDSFFVHSFDNKVGFAIICDGMGGQSGGNIASSMACSIISEKLLKETSLENATDEQIKELLIESVSIANTEVYQTSLTQSGCKGMGTTLVLLLVIESRVYIAHIGDSRAYIYKDGELFQLTRDHSLVQELVEQGKITEDDAKTHPNKNMITRALGVSIRVDIDYLETDIRSGEKILLCTDGLTNMVDDSVIRDMLYNDDGQKVCAKLIKLANDAGGIDNITVVIGQ